ncbi:MAG: HD domain-containing protein [Candidatus Woesearchaeota archaeon]
MDNTKKKEKIQRCLEFIKKEYEKDTSGHDYWHSYRVWKLSKIISKREKINLESKFYIEISAILHDIDDWKFSKSYEKTIKLLENLDFNKSEIKRIIKIIKEISYKGTFRKPETKEAQIVQDADRLDAIGAIGIARTFTYGGYKKRKIYDPNIKPKKPKNFKDYKKNQSTTINHFYEKLLLIKKNLNTKTAKEIAKKRHNFMVKYLKNFYDEWNLKI